MPRAFLVVTVSRFFQRVVFVLTCGILVTLILGLAIGQFGFYGVHASGQQEGAYRQIGVYREVLRHVQTEYVTEPNIALVTGGALRGLLESLDTDSSYLTPTEYKIFKDHPATGSAQVGLCVSKRYGYAVVVDVTPGSPADKEHFSSGDILESIDEHSTREMPLALIRLMLDGKQDSTVALSVLRPRKSDPEKVTLTRSAIQTPAFAQQEYENGTILYLKPGEISQQRVDALEAKIKTAKNQKILLDLRDTFAGDNNQALRLANLFVKDGKLASLAGQKFPEKIFSADPARFVSAAPLAVMVNRGTFGPAELAAAALLDSKRGDIVGERTFGEGSVQKTIELPDGAALLLTVAKFQGPAGKKIQDEAVTPTLIVGLPNGIENDANDDSPNRNDEILQKALVLIKSKNG